MYSKKNRTLARALGIGTASIAAAVLAAAPAQAATASPVSGPVGATVKVVDGSLAGVASPVVQLRGDNCSANYAAPTTPPAAPIVNGLNITKAGDTVTFTVPALPLGTNGVSRTYNICVYPGATATSALIPAASNTQFTVYAPTPGAPANGPSGGGNNVALTVPATLLGGVTAPGAVFTQASCPAVYNAGGTNIPANPKTAAGAGTATTTVTVAVPPGVVGTSTTPTTYNLCLYSGTTANDGLLTASAYAVGLPPITLSSTSGSHDSTNAITAHSGAIGLFGGPNTPGALFTSAPNCPASWNPNNNIALVGNAVRRLSVNRLALTVPRLPLNPDGQPQPYLLCLYNGSSEGATMLAAAAYTSTVLPNPIMITPNAGPATGGITITVAGTDFPTAPGSITATLGGADLLNIVPVNSTSFTATLPARAVQEDTTLVVTTSSGSRALPGAFSFRDSLKAMPNTAPNTVPSLDVAIQGTGFLNYPFGEADDAAKVYLVRGEYNGADIGAGVRSNSPVAECVDVLVISDSELVCAMRLDRRLNATATGFVNPVTHVNDLTADVTTVAGSRTITSTKKSFSPDDIGHPITQANNTDIPAGTVIRSVLSPSKAVLSAAALNTNAAPFDVEIGGSVRTAPSALITSPGDRTVMLAGATFTKADLGRIVTATGVPSGTTITSVAPSGTTATLSAPASTGTEGQVSISATTADSTTISGTFAAGDVGAIIGNNSRGIPPGTRILSQGGGTATLSAPAGVTSATAVTVPVERPVNLTLYPAAAVPQGAYNLTVVSNGAPDAATTDPEYRQTAVTSSSTFTVGSF